MMWEAAISFYFGMQKLESDRLKHELRCEQIHACKSAEQVIELRAQWARDEERQDVERRHRELVQAIRDSKTTVNNWY